MRQSAILMKGDFDMKKFDVKTLTIGGAIAALYVVLTLVANAFGLASGAIQVRLSEALTILPCFTAAAIPGLTVGCVLANLITGCALWDVVFGSLATLIGAAGTYLLRKKPLLAWIPPVLSNAIIVPIVLQKVYGVPDSFWYLMLTVACCCTKPCPRPRSSDTKNRMNNALLGGTALWSPKSGSPQTPFRERQKRK